MIKEKVNKLIAAYCKAYGADVDNVDFLESRLDSFRTYVNIVASMEYRIPILRFGLEGDELKDAIMTLDRQRKVCHDDVINTCKVLNRICDHLGLQKFYEGNVNDRHQVAEFAGRFVGELYELGIAPHETTIEPRSFVDENEVEIEEDESR